MSFSGPSLLASEKPATMPATFNPCTESRALMADAQFTAGFILCSVLLLPSYLLTTPKAGQGAALNEEENRPSPHKTNTFIMSSLARLTEKCDPNMVYYCDANGYLQVCPRGLSFDLLLVVLEFPRNSDRTRRIRDELARTELLGKDIPVPILDRVVSVIVACSAALDTQAALVTKLKAAFRKRVPGVPRPATTTNPFGQLGTAADAPPPVVPDIVAAGKGYLDRETANHPLVFTIITIITHTAVTLACAKIQNVVGFINPHSRDAAALSSYEFWTTLSFPFHLQVMQCQRMSDELAVRSAINAARNANHLVEVTNITCEAYARQLYFIEKMGSLDYIRANDPDNLLDDIPARIKAEARRIFPPSDSAADLTETTPPSSNARRTQRKGDDNSNTGAVPVNSADDKKKKKGGKAEEKKGKDPLGLFLTEENKKSFNDLLKAENVTDAQNPLVWKLVKDRKLLPKHTDKVLKLDPIKALIASVKSGAVA